MPDNVDEFVVKTLMNYDEKEFRSVGAKDLGLESDAEKEEIKSKEEENKPLCDFIKDALDGAVKEVRLSRRMKNNAVCLTADGEISLEMEKVFKAMKNASPVPVTAEKVLEINPDHKIFAKLKSLYDTDKEKLKKLRQNPLCRGAYHRRHGNRKTRRVCRSSDGRTVRIICVKPSLKKTRGGFSVLI